MGIQIHPIIIVALLIMIVYLAWSLEALWRDKEELERRIEQTETLLKGHLKIEH